jgi:hypothetical protein
MRSTIRALAVAALVSMCVAIIACSPPTPSDSGVRGTVRIGPTAPVQQQGEPSDAPYAADLVITDAGGRVVARARSAADGTFSVDLTPGGYTIQGAGGAAPPTPPAPQQFAVRAHEFTTVAVVYDSGIR